MERGGVVEHARPTGIYIYIRITYLHMEGRGWYGALTIGRRAIIHPETSFPPPPPHVCASRGVHKKNISKMNFLGPYASFLLLLFSPPTLPLTFFHVYKHARTHACRILPAAAAAGKYYKTLI